MKLDDLKACATTEPLTGGETATVLSVGSREDADWATHALGRFFAEHVRHTAVPLQIDGSTVGYLNRRHFFSDEDAPSRLSEAQAAKLPGKPEFAFIKLACPVDGCERLILKIHYDERNPERCPRHPDQMLRVVA